ncbi:MAG: J domain-containing protein [Coriobacteriia bacterium]|nr:J domain-containing protein [Coriobacteriia bacterium]
MAEKQNYYDLLGVSKSASSDEIKKAFRKAARTHHPDAGGNEETFKQINEAYEVLSDEKKRSQYDQFGQYFGENGPGPGYGAGGGNPFAGGNPFGGGAGPGGGRGGYQQVDFDMSDIFSMFGGGAGGASPFGGMGGRRRGPAKGQDYQMDVTVSFEESLAGTTRKAHISSTTPGGAGKDMTVTIPAGVVDGQKLKFREKGGVSDSGGPRGDLTIAVSIAPHPYFARSKSDVLLDLPLTMSEAALGASVTVPLPEGGKAKLKVPQGTQTGKIFRMKGKGAPKLKGKGNGDLLVKAVIETPAKLTTKQRKLLRELQELDGDVRGKFN